MNAFIIYKESCGMDEYFRENIFVTLNETTTDKFVSDKNLVKASAFKKLKEYYKIKETEWILYIVKFPINLQRKCLHQMN